MARWTAFTLASLLVVAAVVVAWRRSVGALESPLESLALLAVGLAVAATAGGVRWLWAFGQVGQIARTQAVLLSGAVLLLGLSLSLPDTPLAGLSVFWMLLGIEEGWAWRRAAWRTPRRPSVAASPRDAPQLRLVRDEPAAEEIPPQEVLQQLTRSQAAHGTDQLAGWLRMAFAAGQRTGSLHVAFCPPFAKTPEVAFEQLDGPDARIKTAQLLPYGVRLDLKLSATPAAPGSILLQFSARSDGAVADNQV